MGLQLCLALNAMNFLTVLILLDFSSLKFLNRFKNCLVFCHIIHILAPKIQYPLLFFSDI